MIFHYGEDDDYINRVLYHGLKIGLVPSAQIIHDTSHRLSKSKELSEKARREDIDSFLNILVEDQSLLKQKFYFLRKILISFVRGDKSTRMFFQKRYEVISKNQIEIEKCRQLHRLKQANWL